MGAYKMRNNNKLSRKTLNSYFEDYLEVYAIPRIRATTVEAYRNIWKAFVADTFGKRKLADITRTMIIKSLNKTIKEKNPSNGTVDNITSLLSSCFDRAVTDGYILKNPALKLEKDIAKGRKPKVKVALTDEQQQVFLKFLRESNVYNIYYPMFVFMFGTGTRIGEVSALTWEDVDFQKNMVTICRTICYKKGDQEKPHFIVNEPKTDAGNRQVPLMADVKKALIQQRRNKFALGIPKCEVCGISDYIFTTRTGKPYTNAGINAAVKRMIAAYNRQETEQAVQENREPYLLPDFSCHNTRHTFTTQLCQGTNDIKAIQDILGHSDVSTTLNIYAHCTENQKRESMEELEKRIKLG
ncbi:MAG: site-specific integrase [Lachnospiraceae bacterium]|nr:site-specific integrase [Lachnospiraceae bacterium]